MLPYPVAVIVVFINKPSSGISIHVEVNTMIQYTVGAIFRSKYSIFFIISYNLNFLVHEIVTIVSIN